MTLPTIVVGIDGSRSSPAALRHAIGEARQRTGRVKIVVSWSARKRYLTGRPDLAERSAYDIAEATAWAAVDAAGVDDQERSLIVVECGEGAAGPDLVRTSRNAELLVIGETSARWITRQLRMTTVDHCLRHSLVPVVVVPLSSRAGETAEVATV